MTPPRQQVPGQQPIIQHRGNHPQRVLVNKFVIQAKGIQIIPEPHSKPVKTVKMNSQITPNK